MWEQFIDVEKVSQNCWIFKTFFIHPPAVNVIDFWPLRWSTKWNPFLEVQTLLSLFSCNVCLFFPSQNSRRTFQCCVFIIIHGNYHSSRCVFFCVFQHFIRLILNWLFLSIHSFFHTFFLCILLSNYSSFLFVYLFKRFYWCCDFPELVLLSNWMSNLVSMNEKKQSSEPQ